MAAKESPAALLLRIRQDGSAERSNSTDLSDNQVLALEAVSLSFATISVFSAFVAFYWFVRMRRSFRQDLIMLLIQSDMMKAFWLMLSPIIYFISGPDGPINTNSSYCQISGFFLTAAIEASDIAVLMIAIHSALYIFRGQRARGETGLHPYRWYAYTIWLVVPLIMSALIPLTGARFEDNGPFCYLPLQNGWYRVYVSWVPRYIIFGIIFLVYVFLYVYIAWRFRQLRRDQRRVSVQNVSPKLVRRERRARCHALPPTPPLVHHGLLDLSSAQTPKDNPRSRQQSVTSEVSTLKLNDTITVPPSAQRGSRDEGVFLWKWSNGDSDGIAESSPRPLDETLPTLFPLTTGSCLSETPPPSTPLPVAQRSSGRAIAKANAPPSNTPSLLRQTLVKPFWRRSPSTASRMAADSEPTILGALERDMTNPAADRSSSSTPSLYLPLSATEATLRRSRDKMSRQLRLLFVYPAIYIFAWIAPFISHVYRYENPTGSYTPQPYGVVIASTASLCIGAAVDCCFYSGWEKPWRHSKVGFWEGLAMRLKLGHRPQAGGRSRDEERREATAAIDRRNVEQAEREAAAAATHGESMASVPREWWDLETEDDDDDDDDNEGLA